MLQHINTNISKSKTIAKKIHQSCFGLVVFHHKLVYHYINPTRDIIRCVSVYQLHNIYICIYVYLFIPWLGSSRPWYGAQLAHDPAFEIFRINRLPSQVEWFAASAQQLTLLTVARSKQLCQTPRPWRHNAIPWRPHLQNITGFRNFELDSLSYIKPRVNIDCILYFWHHGIKIKLCSYVIRSTRSPKNEDYTFRCHFISSLRKLWYGHNG